MPIPLRILILEDDPLEAELAITVLEQAGYDCVWKRIKSVSHFLARLEQPDYDLILADQSLPAFEEINRLRLLHQPQPIPLILLSDKPWEQAVLDSIMAGAAGYVLKDYMERLGPVLTRSLQTQEEQWRRRQAEHLLQTTQNYLQKVVNHAPVILFIMDKSGIFTLVEGKGLHPRFSSPNVIVGQSVFELCAGSPEILADIQAALQGQSLHSIREFQGRYFETFYEPIWTAKGQVEQIIGVSLDVSERVKTRLELERQAAQMVLISEIGRKITTFLELDTLLSRVVELVHISFNYHHVAVFLVQGDQLQLKANMGAYQPYLPPSYTQPLSQGLNGWVAVHGQTVVANEVQADSRYTSLIASPVIIRSELCLPIKIGERTIGVLDIRCFDINAFNSHDVVAMETLTAHMAAAIENARLYEALQWELQEHRQVEQALRESEERFRGFIASISDHTYVTEVSAEGYCRNLYLSPHVEAITGYSGELLLQDWSFWGNQVIHPDDRPNAAAQLALLIAGQDSEIEYRLVRADGQIIWVRDSARVQAESPIAKIIYGVVSDITSRKQSEEAIRQLNEELEQRVLDRTRELSALYEVTAAASEALNLKTTLKLSLSRVLTAMRSQVGFIHLLDEQEQVLHLVAEQGLLPEMIILLQARPFKDDVMSQVIKGGEAIVIPNLVVTHDLLQMAAMPHLMTYAGVPIRASGQILGVLNVFGEQEQQFSIEEVALLASIADQVGVLVENARLRQQAEKAAVIEERNRLARELHDAVTQSLYSLTLFSEASHELIQAGNISTLKQTLAQISTISQQALKEMRLLVHELRPLDLQREGLVGALHRRLSAVEGRANIKARLIVENWVELPASVEEELYRIAQEALNNALKHAGASSINIYLRVLEGALELEVVDNGQGFQPAGVQDGGGLGLTSIRERVEKLQGTLTIDSMMGTGTQIKVKVKL